MGFCERNYREAGSVKTNSLAALNQRFIACQRYSALFPELISTVSHDLNYSGAFSSFHRAGQHFWSATSTKNTWKKETLKH